jgi:F-type H+-transporting ATPase subunit delta
MMQGPSRDAAIVAGEQLDRVLAERGSDPDTLSTELFSVAHLLDREVTLRRLLVDQSRSGADRAGLADGLLTAQVSADTRSVVRAAVRERWSRPSDLANALEDLAVQAVVASAERAGRLDEVEDELFRFRRIVLAEPALRTALADPRGDGAGKATLLDSLIGDKVSPQTRTLVDQAVRDLDARSLEHALDHYSGVVAARRERLVAHVRAVTDLTDVQRSRLVAVLARIYGRQIALNVETDPSVLGGLSVRVGDEIVDATVAARLDEARRRLAG